MTTFARLGIAGRRNRNWYDQENDQTDLIGWGEMRPFLFQYIRGKRSPEAFTFSLKLSEMAAKNWIREEGLYQRLHEKKWNFCCNLDMKRIVYIWSQEFHN